MVILCLEEKLLEFMMTSLMAHLNLNLLNTSYKNLNISDEYIKQVNRNISIKKKLKIAVDAGNGVAGPIAVEIYRKLGLELIRSYIVALMVIFQIIIQTPVIQKSYRFNK